MCALVGFVQIYMHGCELREVHLQNQVEYFGGCSCHHEAMQSDKAPGLNGFIGAFLRVVGL